MCIKNAHWGNKDYNKVEEERLKHKESTNSVTRVVVINTETLAQSNKSLTKPPFNWSMELACPQRSDYCIPW